MINTTIYIVFGVDADREWIEGAFDSEANAKAYIDSLNGRIDTYVEAWPMNMGKR